MDNKNFTATFFTDKSPEQVFNAINNVTGWWTENLQGSSQKLNDEFDVHFGEVHYSRQKLTEVIPGKKVVWLITDSKLNFIADESEWTNTKISFDINKEGDKTEVRFTQWGLTPEVECYSACSNAWSDYINNSLRSLINNGKGNPALKEK
jgi:plastocyanin